MKNFFFFMTSAAMVVIAWNVVLIAVHLAVIEKTLVEANQIKPSEEVVSIVGKCDIAFDGNGATVGFIVKNGEKMELVRFDVASPFAKTDAPKYLLRTKYADGKIDYSPLYLN